MKDNDYEENERSDNTDKFSIGKCFGCYFTHYTTVLKVSACSYITNLISFVIGAFVSIFVIFYLGSNDSNSVLSILTGTDMDLSDMFGDNQGSFYLVMLGTFILTASSLICFNVLQNGFLQIYRNVFAGYVTDFFSEYKDGVKSNLGKSFLSMIISWILTSVFLYSICFYRFNFGKTGIFLSVVSVIILFVLFWVQNMVNYMIVSVEDSLINMYKNAFICILLELPRILFFSLIFTVILFVIPTLYLLFVPQYAFPITVLYFAFFAFGTVSFFSSYLTSFCISKYIYSEN